MKIKQLITIGMIMLITAITNAEEIAAVTQELPAVKQETKQEVKQEIPVVKQEINLGKRINIYSSQKMTLKAVFETLSKEYDLYFNFKNDADLRFPIDLNLQNVNFNEIIFILSTNYDVELERISEKQYFVYILNDSEKTYAFDLVNRTNNFENYVTTMYKENAIFYKSSDKLIVKAKKNVINEIKRIAGYFSKDDYKIVPYRLAYIDAAEALEIIKNQIKIENASIDKKNNVLFIEHKEEYKPKIENILKEIDKDETVLVEMMILDKNLNRDESFGFNYDNQFVVNKLSSFDTKQLLPLSLELKQSLTDTRILSQPKILTSSGKKAKIHIGDSMPIIKKVEETTNTSTGEKTRTPEIEYKDLGIVLEVTPKVSADTIAITLNMNINSVNSQQTTEWGNFPVFNTKDLTTDLLLKDGEIIYISGLISEEERKETVNVPVMGNIPVLGKLFRKDKNTPVQSEIIMVIRATKNKNKYDKKKMNFEDNKEYEKNYKKYYENLELKTFIKKEGENK